MILNMTLKMAMFSETKRPDGGKSDSTYGTAQVLEREQSEKSENRVHSISMALTAVLAFAVRAWAIEHPGQVVFDEVHVGKVSDSFQFPNQHPPHVETFSKYE